MSDLDSRLREVEKDLHTVNNALSNGAKAFTEVREQNAKNYSELRADLREQKTATQPKETKWSELLVSLFFVAIAIGGSIYTVSEKFSDRPRWDQLSNVTEPMHDSQKAMARRIEELRLVQYEQKAAIEALEKDIAGQSERLEELRSVNSKRRGK